MVAARTDLKKTLSMAMDAIKNGRLKKAGSILEKHLKRHKEDPGALNLLGTVRMEEGSILEAERLFQKSLSLFPDNPSTIYNLARCLQIQERHTEAERLYLRLIQIAPSFPHSWNNLGLIYKETGRLKDAEKALRKALDLMPANASAINNLGVVLEGLGRLEEALSMFQRAIKLDKTYYSARFNLGCLLFRLGLLKDAEIQLKWVLSVNEHEPTARFLLQSMGHLEKPERAPTQYVEKVFDDWAEEFDRKLVVELRYQTPEKLFEVLKEFLQEKSFILDLGCGTGLGAHLYRPYARFLAGMDCSKKMLEKARAKAVYDALFLHDIEKKWPTKEKFDLIYSSDCLCYFGNLMPVFEMVRRNLKQRGVFGFSVERLQAEGGSSRDYILQTSGRYAHSKGYIMALLEKSGFQLEKMEEVPLRKEANGWVKGYLFCAIAKNQ